MQVKFKVDYAGTLTNEVKHLAGEVVDLSPATAAGLLAVGLVEDVTPAAAPEPKKAKAAK